MYSTAIEVLRFIEENDVKFIHLAFCDIFGTLKNISIMATELPRAFESGISFDASSVKGFMNIEESDLFLYPDPKTISILPWRPQQSHVVRFFCDIKYLDGTSFHGSNRDILKKTINEAENMGYTCKIGAECEFYLFESNEKGLPTKTPHDFAGYFDVSPFDKGENVRREICLALEEMGIVPESSHHEQGPGQNEIDFKYSDALTAADNLITFKTAVKTISSCNGLYASFMPKPLPTKSGSGLHINISLSKNGLNIFNSEEDRDLKTVDSFIAGIMNKINEITVFLNPLTNSYKRLGQQTAPKYITWSKENRSQLIRIPAATGEYKRMELRSADPSCNPYIAFALIIKAGLEGIKNNATLCSPSNFNLYTANPDDLINVKTLPQNLGEAIEYSKNSDFIKSALPEKTITYYLNTKQSEWHNYRNSNNKEEFEYEMYFDER